MNEPRRIDGALVAIPLLLVLAAVAWTQTRSVIPPKVERKAPPIVFLDLSGNKPALKEPPSGGPARPPALSRSERINAIALARRSGNIQAKSLDDAPRPTVVLTPSVTVSGPNRFEVYLGCLFAITDSATGRTTPCATLSGESESCFHFVISVIPGKTYLADFLVSRDPGPWTVSGAGTQAEINSVDQHLLVGFRAVHQRTSLTLRKPNNANGVSATLGPAFFRLELTQID